MNRHEVKQKIVGMLNYYKEDFVNKDSQTGGVCVDFNVVADILIAAGFGFDTSHLKTFQTLDAKLRNAESRAEVTEKENAALIAERDKWKHKAETEKAMRELAELFQKEKCAEYDLLNYQFEKMKRSAEVAERALENACVVILSSRNGDQPRRLRAYYKAYLEAAEKELAEESK